MERLGRYIVVGGSNWFELTGILKRILAMIVVECILLERVGVGR